MANTYSSLFYHFVFSTKNREKFISQDIENRVWAYLGGIARRHGTTAIRVGGIEDHVHILIMSKPKFSPSNIAKYLKGDSSKWIHNEFRKMSSFAWQDGFSVFSVSKSGVSRVTDYIRYQRRNHEIRCFEDEYLDLLDLHEVEVANNKYIFG